MFKVESRTIYSVVDDSTYSVTLDNMYDESMAIKVCAALNEQEIKHNATMAKSTTMQTQAADSKVF